MLKRLLCKECEGVSLFSSIVDAVVKYKETFQKEDLDHKNKWKTRKENNFKKKSKINKFRDGNNPVILFN